MGDSTAVHGVDDKADILKTGSANMSDTEPKDVGDENQQTLLGGEAERKLVRKLDIHIIPVVTALYLLSFLDRVNIGNARLYHLERDLGMHGNMYQTAISLLFVTYIICEVPSNLVLKKFTPSRWIAFIATSWGIIATLGGVVQSYAGLLVVRLFLGAVEAGLFPGLAVYLTFFYTKKSWQSGSVTCSSRPLLPEDSVDCLPMVLGTWMVSLVKVDGDGSSLSKAFRPCLWESQHSGSCPTTPKRLTSLPMRIRSWSRFEKHASMDRQLRLRSSRRKMS